MESGVAWGTWLPKPSDREQQGRAGALEDLAEREAMEQRQSRKEKPRAWGALGILGVLVLVEGRSPRPVFPKVWYTYPQGYRKSLVGVRVAPEIGGDTLHRA